MNKKVNKAGNKRGLFKRSAVTRQKMAVRTLDRAHGQYVRSCDGKVGKYLRVNETPKYDSTLEKADQVRIEEKANVVITRKV